MLRLFLGLAAIIAAASIGLAGLVGRPGASAESAAAEEAAAPRAQPRSGEVQLERAADSHFYAEVEVEGTRLHMLVDSGASIVALTRRDAEAIGLDVDRLPVTGAAGTAGGPVPMRAVMLSRIAVDGIEIRDVQAAVIDADMPASLLGQSYLARLDRVAVEGDTMTLR